MACLTDLGSIIIMLFIILFFTITVRDTFSGKKTNTMLFLSVGWAKAMRQDEREPNNKFKISNATTSRESVMLRVASI